MVRGEKRSAVFGFRPPALNTPLGLRPLVDNTT